MNKQFKPGDAVIIDAGLGITKHGNIQRIAETVAYVKHYNGSVVGYKYEMIKPVVMTEQLQKPYGVGLTSEFSMIQSIMEKKLTPAELKKREEVATAMERENPGMDMSKKMAIATATAKKVAEDVVAESVPARGEVKPNPRLSTPDKKHSVVVTVSKDGKKERRRFNTTHNLGKEETSRRALELYTSKGYKVHDFQHEQVEFATEDTEQIDELSKATLQSYRDQTKEKRAAYNSAIADAGKNSTHSSATVDKWAKKYDKMGGGMKKAANRIKKMGEETDQIDELSNSTLGSYIRKASGNAASATRAAGVEAGARGPNSWAKIDSKEKRAEKRLTGVSKAVDRLTKEEADQIDELSKDTLLNYTSKASDSRVQQKRPLYKRDRSIGGEVKAHKRLDKMYGEEADMHYCAKHVFSERFGEGLVVEGSHAEPTEEGLIEWYDVDFGGQIRRVMTEKVKVMHAEYHMNHKKKMSEEDDEVEDEKEDDKEDEKEVKEAKSHTVPKTAKEKDLASIAHPKDKITHADVLTGRGVKKEEMSSKEKMKRGLYNKEEAKVDEELKGNQHKIDKNKNGKIDAHDFKLLRKEATENLPGKATHLTKTDVRHPEHGIISGSTTLRHLDGNKYEVRAGRAKGKTVAFDDKHVQKMSEEVELDEAMISYSDFQSKIKAHQKAGNQIKDDKYDKKKASYTVIDQEGTAKKITHTDSGVSQQHLGSVKRDDDESSETKPTEKRGRGRPAGSKSGARN